MGMPLQQWPVNGLTPQKWFIRDAGNGKVMLQSVLGNMVLDIPSANTYRGQKVQLWSPNGSDAQLWQLASADVNVPQGTVRINAATSSRMVVEIPSALSANSLQSQLWGWNNTTGQVWQFTSVGNGIYTIANLASHKLLDVRTSANKIGAALQQYQANGSVDQRFIIRRSDNSNVMLQNVGSGLFVDIPNGRTNSGSQLRLWPGNYSGAQQFKIQAVDRARVTIPASSDRVNIDALANQHKQDLKDGTYRFVASTNHTFSMSVANQSSDNFANVQLGVQNGMSSQEWNVAHDSQGYVTLTNVGTGKLLDLANGLAEWGRNIRQVQANGAYAQKWIAVRQGSGYVFLSAMDTRWAVDIANNSMSSGTNIRLWKTNGASAQRWDALAPLVGIQRADMMVKAYRGTLRPGAHRFASSINSNFMLDLQRGSSLNNTNIRLWGANGAVAQLWMVETDGQGYVTLINAGTGKALDVQGGRPDWGQNIRQWPVNHSRAQKWIAVPEAGGIVFRSALDPSMALDVERGIMTPGTNVRLWGVNGAPAQRWVG